MPLSSQALTTVARFESVPGMNGLDSSALEPLIEEASAELCSEIGRKIHYRAGAVAHVRGFGSAILRLYDHVPLVSVSEILYDGEPIDANGYEVVDQGDDDVGHIRARNALWRWTADRTTDITGDPLPGSERALYRITYTGGYVTPQQAEDDASLTRNLPHDIERAVIDMVVSLRRNDGRDGRVVSKRVSKGSASFAEDGYPPTFRRVIQRYRRGL